MSRFGLASWNKQRLRGLLLLFFVALAIPTGILIKQAYSQLKWEAFHRHRLMAEELVARIDQRYSELIGNENARAFTDYAFLNVAGDVRANSLQRSQLSSYPVNATVPGTLGYFQIDHKGRFTTPLVPEDNASVSVYGINQQELAMRRALHQRLYQLLSDNQMVVKLSVPQETVPGLESVEKAKQKEKVFSPSNIDEPEGDFSPGADNINEGIVLAKEEGWESGEVEEEVVSQRAFDKLQDSDSFLYKSRKRQAASSEGSEGSVEKSIEKKAAPRSLGRVEDLKLEKTYQNKLSEQKYMRTDNNKESSGKKSRRPLRKEQNVLPSKSDATSALSKLENTTSIGAREQTKVSIFESEIDTFEFGVLDTGHFVIYRKVWKDGQRYTQGMLLEPAPFISAIIEDSFYKTAVSQASDLAIAFQGAVLYALSSRSNISFLDNTSELQGTLLLHSRLSDPLDQLELIFSVDNLPAGPGGTFLTWTSALLLVVFCGGFLLIYRLGLRQITLARQQQDFVSAVSHELKTPLTSIRMYSEMLREGWTDEAKRKTYYDYIYDESERLTRLINNVLQLARMTRNDLHTELKPCEISQLLDNLRSKVQSQVEHAGFTLNIECDDSLAEQVIEVDADYFSQIFINLVDNAIKFSLKAEQKKIVIHCQQLRDDHLQISIRDHGPGVGKDQMRKIFRLFYRSENELTRETVGTGIGLSLVQQLVQAMQGRIDVVNQEPGAEFRISFPLVRR